MDDLLHDIFDPEFLGFDLDFEQEVASLFSPYSPGEQEIDSKNSGNVETHDHLSARQQYRKQEPPIGDLPRSSSANSSCDISSDAGSVAGARPPQAPSTSPAQMNHHSTLLPHHLRATGAKKKRRKVSKAPPSGVEVMKKSRMETIPEEDLVSPDDPRRGYAKIFLNAFNSSDIKVIEQTFYKYCDSTDNYSRLVLIHRYDGVKNPYGRDYLQLAGVSTVISLWEGIIKSTPDQLFTPLETRACYLPQAIAASHAPRSAPGDRVMIVACRYQWLGTRLRNITIAEKLEADMQALSLNSSESSGERVVIRESGYFDNSQSTPLPLQHPKFHIDDKPLPTRIKVKLKGTLVLYLVERAADAAVGSSDPASSTDLPGKIAKMEFVFSHHVEDDS